METPKTFKELFANTGIEPTTDESGNTHYNFKATMKEEPKQKSRTAVEWLKPQIELILMDGYKLYPNELEEVFEIAKEMEKQQQDEFAIAFAEWCLKIRFEPIENVSVKKLLEIYKKDNL
jgi:hypothetical protein